jgi:hypothetical protein
MSAAAGSGLTYRVGFVFTFQAMLERVARCVRDYHLKLNT